MALRKFTVKTSEDTTGEDIIKEANEQRGVVLKGIKAGTGITITEDDDNIIISLT